MFSSCLVKPCRVFMAKLTRPTKLTLLKQVESCSQFITIFFFFFGPHRTVRSIMVVLGPFSHSRVGFLPV